LSQTIPTRPTTSGVTMTDAYWHVPDLETKLADGNVLGLLQDR